MAGGANPQTALVAAANPTSLTSRAFRTLRKLGPTGVVALAACVLPGTGALLLYGRLGVLASWLRDHAVAGPVACVGIFAVAGGIALVPTYAMSALCGWCFGFGVGLTATMFGFISAALVGYTLSRSIDSGRALKTVNEMPRWRTLRAALVTGRLSKLVLVVALVRLAPAAPFSLTNVLMSAAQVPVAPYAFGTALGMLPRTAVLVFAASKLNNVDAPLAGEPWLLAGGAVVTVAVVVALGWIGKKGLAQLTDSAVE